MAQLYMIKAVHPLIGTVGGHLLVEHDTQLAKGEEMIVDLYHDCYIYEPFSIRIAYNDLISIPLDKFEITMCYVQQHELELFQNFNVQCGGIAFELAAGLIEAEERGDLLWQLGYHMC